MKVWHFTSRAHLPLILRDGVIETTESNLSQHQRHAGPDVVWCFSTPEPRFGRAKDMLMAWAIDESSGYKVPIDKRLVRFTLNLPGWDVVDYLPWARELDIDRRWLASLTGAVPADEWRCVLRPVVETEWEAIEWRERVAAPWQPVKRRGPKLLSPGRLSVTTL